MEQQALPFVIYFSSILLFVILILVFVLFNYFQRKKLNMIIKQKEQEKEFEEMLVNSQIEINENALKNISWELHDNIGQMLSVARIQLNRLSKKEEQKPQLTEVNQLIGDSLEEIRSLSRTLNADVINNLGLVPSIKGEIERFNRLSFLDSKLEIIGEAYDIPNDDEIILFRIVQEFFANTIKHAEATHLEVEINYQADKMIITASDNGKGFDIEKVKKNSGLINMQSRATIIGTQMNITSDKEGTTLTLTYPNKTNKG